MNDLYNDWNDDRDVNSGRQAGCDSTYTGDTYTNQNTPDGGMSAYRYQYYRSGQDSRQFVRTGDDGREVVIVNYGNLTIEDGEGQDRGGRNQCVPRTPPVMDYYARQGQPQAQYANYDEGYAYRRQCNQGYYPNQYAYQGYYPNQYAYQGYYPNQYAYQGYYPNQYANQGCYPNQGYYYNGGCYSGGNNIGRTILAVGAGYLLGSIFSRHRC